MSILVTGAGGVLGRNLLAFLRARDRTVFASARQDGPKVDLIWDVDVQDRPDPEPQVETVVHVAAKTGSYRGSLIDSDLLFQTNVLGTLRVARWCSERHVQRLVLISGAIVYGQWETSPKTETDAPTPWVAGPYAVSKYCSEQAAMLVEQLGCKLMVLRLSSLYGLEYRASLIHRLLRQGQSKRKIVLSPPVEDAFDLLHVEDAARTIANALEQQRDGIFNVGAGCTVTLLELASLCAEVTDAKLIVTPELKPRAPRIINWVDDAPARAHLDHINCIDLRDAVVSMAVKANEI